MFVGVVADDHPTMIITRCKVRAVEFYFVSVSIRWSNLSAGILMGLAIVRQTE